VWIAGGGAAQVSDFPFRVISRIDPNNPLQLQLGVIHDSHVFMSDDADSYDEPNDDWGLLTQDIESAAGWFNVGGIIDYGKKIWLQIEFNEQLEIESIDVNFETVGSTGWTQYPDPIEINTDDPEHPYQQFYHQIIAEITDPDQDYRDGNVYTIPNSGTPPDTIQVTQLLHENIMLVPAHTTGTANEPNVQLYVNSATYDAGTDTNGNAERIPDETDLMTPWQNGERENIWNFRLFNGTDDTGPGIVILDGMFNGQMHPNMGSDNFRIDVTEWDSGDGEVDIVLTVDYQLDGTFTPDDMDIMAVKPENYPEDEPGHVIAIGLGVAYVDNGRIVEVRNTQLGDIDRDLAPLQVYGFQMFDSSTEADGANVRIFDGDVIDQDGEGHTPNEMGNDDFEAGPLNDGDEIWISITHDEHWNVTETPDINWGPNVDDDTDTVANIVIGYVEVFPPDGPFETVPQVIPHNTVCGDVEFLPPPPDDVNFDFKLEDASDGGTAQVRIYDGVVIGPNDDPIDPSGMPTVGDGYVIGAFNGMEIWLGVQWDLETDDGVSGDNIVAVWIDSGAATPDDDYLTQYITIGNVEVEFDDFSGDAVVFPINELCGDCVIQYPPSLDSDEPLQLVVDADTGNVVWKKRFGVKVSSYNIGTDEDDDVENVTAIRFEPAADPSQAYISIIDEGVDVDGFHVATLQVPLIPESVPGQFSVLVDDDGDTHWGATQDCQ